MATWYWKGQADIEWYNLDNWWSNANGTGSHPATIPWATAATKDDDLAPADTVVNNPRLQSYSLGFQFTITGTCSIPHILCQQNIWGGTFTGDYFKNSGVGFPGGRIYGGTFTGDYFTNWSGGYINSGTFSGYNFVNAFSAIDGGVFSGSDFWNDGGNIYGGTFTGDYFVNQNGGRIWGGTFTGPAFTNIDNNSTIADGTFSGDGFTNQSIINGGEFTGNYFVNENNIYVSSGTINNGKFSGGYFTNNSIINNGKFTGTDFYNNSGTINGGMFISANFINDYRILGGTFSGSNFADNYGAEGGIWWSYGSMQIDGDIYTASGDYNYFFSNEINTGILDANNNLVGDIASQTDLAAENILTGKTILGVAGTFDESSRNTDPGESNVLMGTNYKIHNVNKTGTLVVSVIAAVVSTSAFLLTLLS